ncbi:MAG: GC-type dockerin domain-anchored protein [Planctomycetota bacterium]
MQQSSTIMKNTTRTLATAAALVALAGAAQAQRFQEYVGTEFEDFGYDIEQARDGGWITVGSTEPFDQTVPDDIYVVRYDPFGVPAWAFNWGESGTDVGYSVAPCENGDWVIAGQTDGPDDRLGLVVMRVDDGGSVLWSNVYRGDVFAELINPGTDGTPPQVAVRESKTGDVVVVSNVVTGLGQTGTYLRTDGGGALLTHVAYTSPLTGEGESVTFTDIKEVPNGDELVISGWFEGFDGRTGGTMPADAFAMRIRPDGSIIWAHRIFNSNFPDTDEIGYGIDVAVDPTNGVETIALAVGADLFSAASIDAQHILLDPAGLPVDDIVLQGFLPSYSGTRFHPETLELYTAGENLGLPAPTGLFAGFGAGVSYDFPLIPDWVFSYGPLTDAPGRLEGVHADIFNPDGCGANFIGWKSDIELSIGATGASDKHMVKVNDDGDSGCFQQEHFAEQFRLVPNFQRLQFQPNFFDDQVKWGQLRGQEAQLRVLCFDDRCVDTPPCKPDLTTTGATLPGQPGFGIPDGVVDLDDLGYFLGFWLMSDPVADFTTTGATLPGQPGYCVPDGVVDLDDLGAYLTLWRAGC